MFGSGRLRLCLTCTVFLSIVQVMCRSFYVGKYSGVSNGVFVNFRTRGRDLCRSCAEIFEISNIYILTGFGICVWKGSSLITSRGLCQP